jgi:hypothetical protein
MTDQAAANLVEVKTSDLAGAALDWAAAKANDRPVSVLGNRAVVCGDKVSCGCPYRPSTDWAQGGPLLDRFDIAMNGGHDGGADCIYATLRCVPVTAPYRTGCGPTRLIAAKRAIVAAKLGDTVKVPAELMP